MKDNLDFLMKKNRELEERIKEVYTMYENHLNRLHKIKPSQKSAQTPQEKI